MNTYENVHLVGLFIQLVTMHGLYNIRKIRRYLSFDTFLQEAINRNMSVLELLLPYTVIQFCVMGRSIRSRKVSFQPSNCYPHVCQNTVELSLCRINLKIYLRSVHHMYIPTHSLIPRWNMQNLSLISALSTIVVAVWSHTNPALAAISVSAIPLQFNLTFFLFNNLQVPTSSSWAGLIVY